MKVRTWHKVILGFLMVGFALRLASERAPRHPYYAGKLDHPLVIAHQGGDGIWPGDTMFAFQHAVDLGVDVLEMDLHVTKDDILVLMHDETVDRTTDGTGAVESMTLAEIKQLDAGYHWTADEGATFPYRGQGITVPTLEEVFRAFPDMRMTIEIKKTGPSVAKPFCSLIRAYQMQDRVLVASFHDERMKEFRRVCPEVATSGANDETTVFVVMTKAFLGGFHSPGFYSLQVPEESSGITIMTQAFVNAAHERRLAVEPWTINDPEQMKRYIEWGVDGIITDRPDIMLELLGR